MEKIQTQHAYMIINHLIVIMLVHLFPY